MKSKTRYSILITTTLLVMYIIFAHMPFPYALILLLFLMTSGSLLWMVYAILTDTTDLSDKTFDDYFYEDSGQKHKQ
jgi:hypothetical protein